MKRLKISLLSGFWIFLDTRYSEASSEAAGQGCHWRVRWVWHWKMLWSWIQGSTVLGKKFQTGRSNHAGKLSPQFEHWYSRWGCRLCDVLKDVFEKQCKSQEEIRERNVWHWSLGTTHENRRSRKMVSSSECRGEESMIDYHKYEWIQSGVQGLRHADKETCLSCTFSWTQERCWSQDKIHRDGKRARGRYSGQRRLEHQGLLNILDMSEPETPVQIVLRILMLQTWPRVKMQTYFLVFISSLSI